MAHETTIHRVDAEQAVGRAVSPVAPELAVDGIDEVFSVFVATFTADQSPGDGRTVHLHSGDAEGEWLIRFDPGEVVVEPGHAKGDAAVRGPAADLLLWLWGRRPLDGLDVFGDRGAAEALRELTTF
jgi:predicted lipid carrier protein YhbT